MGSARQARDGSSNHRQCPPQVKGHLGPLLESKHLTLDRPPGPSPWLSGWGPALWARKEGKEGRRSVPCGFRALGPREGWVLSEGVACCGLGGPLPTPPSPLSACHPASQSRACPLKLFSGESRSEELVRKEGSVPASREHGHCAPLSAPCTKSQGGASHPDVERDPEALSTNSARSPGRVCEVPPAGAAAAEACAQWVLVPQA